MHGLTRAKKIKILKLHGDNCFYCGTKLIKYWKADHVLPKSKGGTDALKNLVPSCSGCNASKLDLTINEWITMMKTILNRFEHEHS